jgi:hypothetical protein
VREAGGVVLHAGRVSNKGELLEDWKARVGGGWAGRLRSRPSDAAGASPMPCATQPRRRLAICPAACVLPPMKPACTTPIPMQDAVLQEQPLRYNKEDLLNPCFVVFAKRRAAA